MIERGEHRHNDEQRRQAQAWIQARLEAWDVDPDLIASMSSDEVWAELEATGATYEDVQALRTWVDQKLAPESAVDTTPNVRPAASPPPGADRAPAPRRRTAWTWRLAAAAVVLCVVYVTLWAAGRTTRSPMSELAAVDTNHEALAIASAALPTKSAAPADSSTWRSEIRAGTTALLHARTTTLGLFPRYDPVAASLGVASLERAYASLTAATPDTKSGDGLEDLVSNKDGPSPGVVALLIAKGYLMLDDPSSARTWLQRSMHHAPHPAVDEATTLLAQLPEPSPSP